MWYKSGHKQSDTKDSTASFVHNRNRENIKSGETHSTIFGKIARYFADLKMVAFTGGYKDLNGIPSSFPPSSHKHGKADITDFPTSMPASDVHDWAKAANKPSYSWSDINQKDDVITATNYKDKINILDNGVIIRAKNSVRDNLNSPYLHKAEIRAVANDIIIQDSYYDQQYNTNKINEMLRIRVSPGITATNNIDGLQYGIYPIFDRFYFGNDLFPLFGITTKYLHVNEIMYTQKIKALNSTTENNITYRSAINIFPKIIQIGCDINGGGECIVQIVTAVSENYNKRGLVPGHDNQYILGSSNLKWSDIYCNNASIQTSDRNEKRNISYIGQDSSYDTYMDDDTVYDFVMGLLACIYNRVDADSGRPHHGFIAQDVKSLMNKLGISDHAAFIKSPKYINVEYEEEETYVDETDGQTKTRTVTKTKPELVPGEYIYGLRYEEFIPDITRVIQIQDKKIKEQDAKIKEQDEKIKDLEERLSILENMVKAS